MISTDAGISIWTTDVQPWNQSTCLRGLSASNRTSFSLEYPEKTESPMDSIDVGISSRESEQSPMDFFLFMPHANDPRKFGEPSIIVTLVAVKIHLGWNLAV
jgi:hypothetical protein